MLAVYGLRPRELFINPKIDWWLSEDNTDMTWKVDRDCKTGEREALPLYKQWIADFDLINPKHSQMLIDAVDKKYKNNYAHITALTQKTSPEIKKPLSMNAERFLVEYLSPTRREA